MVKLCPYEYPKEEEVDYQQYYQPYSYELHYFQKWAIKGIVDGNHVLVCAPTGSGKTMPGEFAIQYFHQKGKKVIYTSPIKALSNEKFHNFTQKYPNISVGLITGDIKTNPDADVLIMTTEILLNKLYQIKSDTKVNSSVSFDMDIENELGCVIFDEIHMINDESRGHVWEQCIMMLPPYIQMVGLSATLDNPEKFALWLENKGDSTAPIEKEVYLTRKLVRAVPLIHYSFITAPSMIYKRVKDKAVQQEIKGLTNKPFVIQNEKGVFQNTNYQNMDKMLQLFQKHEVRIKRPLVLNQLAEYLVEKEMLPALCYVFSRKQLEICANELTTNLLEFDSKVPYIIDNECEQIIRKLPNYKEYLELPEYLNTVKLLRKGVGIHHAGLLPILREMTELLFAKGYIKMLFCTETMSVGINLPVKTTIFTDINKYNGDIVRMLYSHEYTQAAGRAGRLGLDKVGHVIHLNNLFRNIDLIDYKTMMSGKPPHLRSKFKVSYNLLLNLLDIGEKNLVGFTNKSMITDDINNELKETEDKLSELEKHLENVRNYTNYLNTPTEIIQQYIDLVKARSHSINKKRKEIDRQLKNINENYKFIEKDKANYERISIIEKEIERMKQRKTTLNNYFFDGVENVIQLLKELYFVERASDGYQLTFLGKLASQIKEVHCLIFAILYDDKNFENLDTIELIMLFSCFTSVTVSDENRVYNLNDIENDNLSEVIYKIKNLYDKYRNIETTRNIYSGIEYNMHYDLINYVRKWIDCTDKDQCEMVLQDMASKKGIFLGEFVKSLLKINNIASEMEKMAEITENMAFLQKLKDIPALTLKYVVTNQSLYV